MYSPSHELYLHVCESVKFGLLGATKTIISEKSFYSSAISLDFSKMYLNTIKNMSNPPLSITLKYEKLGSSYWCDSNRRRHCYSNLIISFMNHIFTSSFYCALNGKEIYVNNYPVDAIIFHPDETKSTFQFCKYMKFNSFKQSMVKPDFRKIVINESSNPIFFRWLLSS